MNKTTLSGFVVLLTLVSFHTACGEDTGCCDPEGFVGVIVTGTVIGSEGAAVEEAMISGTARTQNDCANGDLFLTNDSTATTADGAFEVELLTFGGGTPGTEVAVVCVRVVAEPPAEMAAVPDTAEVKNIELTLFDKRRITVDMRLRQP